MDFLDLPLGPPARSLYVPEQVFEDSILWSYERTRLLEKSSGWIFHEGITLFPHWSFRFTKSKHTSGKGGFDVWLNRVFQL